MAVPDGSYSWLSFEKSAAMPLEVSVVVVGKTVQLQRTVEEEYFARLPVEAAGHKDFTVLTHSDKTCVE